MPPSARSSTNLANNEDSFANNEAFKNKINNLVLQYIRESFNITRRISKENIMTNIMLNYNVKAVNTVTKHVAEVTKTVSSHGNFILEQGQ